MTKLFGLTEVDLQSDKFLNVRNLDEWKNCSLKLVEIGAACDHAQPGLGPLTYLLAIEWAFVEQVQGQPKPNLRRDKGDGPDAEWRSPVLRIGVNSSPGRISVFSNCAMTIPRVHAEKWIAVYRFRDELVSELTQKYARHISRPGLVSLG